MSNTAIATKRDRVLKPEASLFGFSSIRAIVVVNYPARTSITANVCATVRLNCPTTIAAAPSRVTCCGNHCSLANRSRFSRRPDDLTEDRAELLVFYDFAAEHWLHLRTTNPIESTFATVLLRHRRTKGNGSRTVAITMVFDK